jgi:hypothetical protein
MSCLSSEELVARKKRKKKEGSNSSRHIMMVRLADVSVVRVRFACPHPQLVQCFHLPHSSQIYFAFCVLLMRDCNSRNTLHSNRYRYWTACSFLFIFKTKISIDLIKT